MNARVESGGVTPRWNGASHAFAAAGMSVLADGARAREARRLPAASERPPCAPFAWLARAGAQTYNSSCEFDKYKPGSRRSRAVAGAERGEGTRCESWARAITVRDAAWDATSEPECSSCLSAECSVNPGVARSALRRGGVGRIIARLETGAFFIAFISGCSAKFI